MTAYRREHTQTDTLTCGNAPQVGGTDAALFTWAPVHINKFGAVDTLDADGICDGKTSTGAATLTMSGALVSGGVATLDVARCVTITSTGNESGVNFTITGTRDGDTITQTLAGPNATTVTTLKSFDTVVSVAVDAALTSSNVDVGSSDTYGSDVKIATKGDVLYYSMDGVPQGVTVVVADTTAATATTGDTRGTVLATTAANGTREFTLAVAVADFSTETNTYGVTGA